MDGWMDIWIKIDKGRYGWMDGWMDGWIQIDKGRYI